jgi:uncharacterized protein YceK
VNRSTIAVALAAMIALAGCSAVLPGDQPAPESTPTPEEGVAVENSSAGATDVNQTLRIDVDDSMAGAELAEVGATYPRDRFAVDAAQHEDIALGIDTDGNGEIDRAFDETHISGVNNNEYSFDITMDTGYTLEAGDTIVLGYPAVSNPDEPGEYDVEVRVNGQSAATATVTIE